MKPVTTEVMLAAVCDKSLSVLNDANWYWTSATYGPRLNLIRTFVNTYLMEDGTPFTDKEGYKTMVFMDEVKNRDKRLQQTIRMGDYKRIMGGCKRPLLRSSLIPIPVINLLSIAWMMCFMIAVRIMIIRFL